MINKYYLKKKEKLWKEARKRCQNLSEEEKEKKRQYHREHNKNLSEEEKEKKVEYMKNYYLAHKKYLLSWFVDFRGPGGILFHRLELNYFHGSYKKFSLIWRFFSIKFFFWILDCPACPHYPLVKSQ